MSFASIRRGFNAVSSNDPNISNLIAEEKDFVSSLGQAKSSCQASTTYLKLWGSGEAGDLIDITSKYEAINREMSMAFAEWEDAHNKYREKMKIIKDLTDNLASLKSKIKACNDRLQKAIKNNKNAESIQAELGGLELQLRDETADFENQKRAILKEAMITQYEGVMKFSLKTQQIGLYGKHLAHQIPQTRVQSGEHVPDFMNNEITQQVLLDFESALYTVPKEVTYANPYPAPELLNMDSLQLNDFQGPVSPLKQPPTSVTTSKAASNNELLWDVAVSDEEGSKLAKPLSTKRPVPEIPQNNTNWASFGSTEQQATPASAQSSSSNVQLPSDFVDNPW